MCPGFVVKERLETVEGMECVLVVYQEHGRGLMLDQVERVQGELLVLKVRTGIICPVTRHSRFKSIFSPCRSGIGVRI